MEIDLSSKCRVCLSDDDQMHDLFAEFDQGIILVDILKSTTNFEVAENDGLPPYLCQNCTTITVDFFNLKAIYKENEEQVRAVLLAAQPSDNDRNVETNVCLDELFTKDDPLRDDLRGCENETNIGLVKCENLSSASNNIDNDSDGQLELNAETSYDDNVDERIVKAIESTDDSSVPDEIDGSLIQIDHKGIILQYQEIKKYTCPFCDECFMYADGIGKHMSIKHEVDAYDYEELSNVTYIKLKQISDIDKIDSGVLCQVCSVICETEEDRRHHLETHKKHICDICGLNFLKKSYLKDHMETHMQEKRHVCEYCNKAFQRRTVLVKHRRIHTHPRECICEVCGKAFNDKGTLKTHIMLVHVKSRNYVCMICGMRFPLKATLEKHIRRHAARNRDFICKICAAAYKDKSSLDRHFYAKHSGATSTVVRRASCKDCGKQYAQTSIQKHRKVCRQKKRFCSDDVNDISTSENDAAGVVNENDDVKEEIICLNYELPD